MKKPKFGFTLIELLVSIAIFAVLSALGWKIFDYLVKVKDRNAQHEAALSELQESYQQIQRDLLQAMPLIATEREQIQPALILNRQKLSFSKVGVTDPLKQGLSPYERVEYVYHAADKVLYRLKYPYLTLSSQVQPQSSVLLKDVENYQIVVLKPEELEQWPDRKATVSAEQNEQQASTLHKGIKIKMTVKGVEYEWIFSLLNTDFLQTSASQPNVP